MLLTLYMLVVVDLVSGTNGFPIRICSGASRVPPLWATGTSLGGPGRQIRVSSCEYVASLSSGSSSARIHKNVLVLALEMYEERNSSLSPKKNGVTE